MKTGFICASGFNLVASATRNGRRLIAVVLGAPSSAARALKAAQLLERGFNSSSGLTWLMQPFSTVESVQPIGAAPPNLRDEMCGGHRKRPASEDEDDFVANNNPESPYAVFLASLHPGKAKGTAPLQEKGEPVLVYTGTKPPAPGSQASTESKPEKKKTAVIKPAAAKDKDDASTTSAPASRTAPKPKKATAAKDGAKDGAKDAGKDGASTAAASSGDTAAPKPKPKVRKDAAKDGASASAAASDDASAPKPKPKKPAPTPPPMVVTPAADQSSQVK